MRRFLGTIAAVCAVALLPLASAGAQSTEDKKKQVDTALEQQRGDLHDSSRALAEAVESLQRISLQLPAARQRHASALSRLAAARADHERLSAELRGAVASVAAAEASVAAARAKLDASRAAVGSFARAVYMQGPMAYAGAVLDARTPSEVLDRAAFFSAVMRDRSAAMEEAAAARADLASRAASLAQRRAVLAERERSAAGALESVRLLVAEAEAARQAVERQVAESARARRVAERERDADLRRYRALQAESKRLAAQIARDASRGTGRVGRGGLLWPTEGPITSGYGYRTHPIYGYRRFHAGVDIGAPTGQPIVAARAGKVVHAGPMGTYGNLVVVDHGDGFSTAYAHQSRVVAREGASVRGGQVVGYVGSTGASTGPHLHYETRVNGEPVDPMRYY